MNDLFLLFLFLVVVVLTAWPVGLALSRIFEGGSAGFLNFFRPVENVLTRLSGVKKDAEMNWKEWIAALLVFSAVKIVVVFLILFFQNYLPLNPQNRPGVPWDLALNTAASFITNTNWQNYGGESALSYFSQMVALAVQNFLSAASGIAVMLALFRAFSRKETTQLGNFWVDMIRSIVYVLIPLSLVYSLFLISQGVIQNFLSYQDVKTLAGGTQSLPGGPAASQIAIKMLGTNGGGFFGANSAYPFENPTPFTNFVETWSIVFLPAALVFTFGGMIKDKRQSWALFTVMTVVFVGFTVWGYSAETAPFAHPVAGVDWKAGNMEGKETRFGVADSVLWSTATTVTSNGSVNSMHDSYQPIAGMVPMVLIQLGEVIYGGIGSGMYGMLAMVLLTVFVGGLMVGRTPEYLGKKIEPFDMKMIVVAVMATPLAVLLATAAAVLWHNTPTSLTNSGPHGFSEILYAYSSQANNNGSAFGGFNGNTHFQNTLGAMTMLFGRFAVMVPILVLAGSLVKKKTVAPSLGTLPTHGLTFGILLIGFIVVVAALNFFPALALGPIADYFQSVK